ncbi:unnamed protein product [Durusdinium trenchii]|uniref:Uncharacterized protein n=3 Tax=Durusdinium trenchii TaxID=1381693 RepID=A0ABP0IBD5_9DINO
MDNAFKVEVRAAWLERVVVNGTDLVSAPEPLKNDRSFLLEAVQRTKASWLLKLCSEELQEDAELAKEVDELAGTGLIFTYYENFDCFQHMRKFFMATGASVPGGEAYDEVMEVLEETDGGSATVWFGDTPVFGFAANNGEWIHPPYECGRDYKPVPAANSEREPMWHSDVESRKGSFTPEAESRHPCWCCHWLREVRKKHEEGAVIGCAISNIYYPSWVDKYGAASSELSDAAAEEFGLRKEQFRNGRPENWGKGMIRVSRRGQSWQFSREAPVHPHTRKPLGEGCRWERQALDGMGFAVYAFFMP